MEVSEQTVVPPRVEFYSFNCSLPCNKSDKKPREWLLRITDSRGEQRQLLSDLRIDIRRYGSFPLYLGVCNIYKRTSLAECSPETGDGLVYLCPLARGGFTTSIRPTADRTNRYSLPYTYILHGDINHCRDFCQFRPRSLIFVTIFDKVCSSENFRPVCNSVGFVNFLLFIEIRLAGNS